MGPLTKKIEIYDNTDYNIAEKLGAPSETGLASKGFWYNDYKINVISSETGEKMYTVIMEPDGSWLQAKVFRMAWNEIGAGRHAHAGRVWQLHGDGESASDTGLHRGVRRPI